MSLYSKVTEQHLINLRNLADQQKNQQALKIKIRILKLAENLSPIIKVNGYTEEMGEVIEESQTENNIPQPSIEHTTPHQPKENN